MGKETLQSLESDFNPFAMRTELSFNLPNASLGKLSATPKGKRNSPVGNECFLTRNPKSCPFFQLKPVRQAYNHVISAHRKTEKSPIRFLLQ